MPRTTLALTSFVSGEFSAKMDGRTDFDKYTISTEYEAQGKTQRARFGYSR